MLQGQVKCTPEMVVPALVPENVPEVPRNAHRDDLRIPALLREGRPFALAVFTKNKLSGQALAFQLGDAIVEIDHKHPRAVIRDLLEILFQLFLDKGQLLFFHSPVAMILQGQMDSHGGRGIDDDEVIPRSRGNAEEKKN